MLLFPSRVTTEYSASICKSLQSSLSRPPVPLFQPEHLSTDIFTFLFFYFYVQHIWNVSSSWSTSLLISPPCSVLTLRKTDAINGLNTTTHFYSLPFVVTDTFLPCIRLSPAVPTCYYTPITLLLFSTLSVVLYCWAQLFKLSTFPALSVLPGYPSFTCNYCVCRGFSSSFLSSPCPTTMYFDFPPPSALTPSGLFTDHNVTSHFFFNPSHQALIIQWIMGK